MFDVVTIGTATRDVFLESKGFHIIKSSKFDTGLGECFAYGSKVPVDDIYFDTGGGATNAASTFANLGFQTSIHSRIGNNVPGKEVLDILRFHKVNTSNIHISTTEKTAYSTILLTKSGDRTVLVYRGVSQQFNEKHVAWSKMKARWFYITSVGGDIAFLKKVFAFAKKNNINIAWNPGGDEIKKGLKTLTPLIKQCTILHLNREEAAKLTKRRISNLKGLFSSLCKITNHYVVITDGTKGAYSCDGSTTLHAAPLKVSVSNTTGAGDAFGSAYTAGIMKEDDMKYALQLGSLNAAGVVQKMGAKNGLLPRIPSEVALSRIKTKEIK